MNKKYLISIICILVIFGLLGVFYFINKPYYIVTIDINPSIQIDMDRNDKVKRIKALNSDAKEVIKGIEKGGNLGDTINSITRKAVEKDYVKDDNLVLLMHATREVDKDEIEKGLSQEFDGYRVEVVEINNITLEDEIYARRNGISPAKAAYINEIADNIGVSKEELVEKPIEELEESKDTGFYCDNGYKLEGSNCIKEIGREKAEEGMVCPREYTEENGKCYKEGKSIETGNLICHDEFNMVNGKCIRTHSYNAIPVKYTCSSGEAKTRLELGLSSANDGDANDITCVDYSKATHPVSPCELPASDPTERMSSGGKCYWHKAPVIATGCPGKIKVGGFCWDDASNILICAGYRDGKQYKSRSEYCEHSIKYTKPTVTEYKCSEENARLEGNKCIIEEIEDPEKERVCETGYSFTESGRCINQKDVKDITEGYICEKHNSRLEGTTCIIFEEVEAKHNS